jgi:hypothetical protein
VKEKAKEEVEKAKEEVEKAKEEVAKVKKEAEQANERCVVLVIFLDDDKRLL